METPPAKPQVSEPLPNPDDVRSWSCRRLLDYLDPIFSLFGDNSIKAAFQDALIDGTCFLEEFGNTNLYAQLGIPSAPGWRLAKQANDIMGKTTPRLQLKRTLNRLRRWQLLKCLGLTSLIGPLESAELGVNVRSQKRPAPMLDPEDTGRDGNYGSPTTGEVFPADCCSLPELAGKDFEDGRVLAGLVARSVQVEQPAFPGLDVEVAAGPLPPQSGSNFPLHGKANLR